MRPEQPPKADHDDLFRARLDSIINMRHELVLLGDRIDWHWIDEPLADRFATAGQPAEPGLPLRSEAWRPRPNQEGTPTPKRHRGRYRPQQDRWPTRPQLPERPPRRPDQRHHERRRLQLPTHPQIAEASLAQNHRSPTEHHNANTGAQITFLTVDLVGGQAFPRVTATRPPRACRAGRRRRRRGPSGDSMMVTRSQAQAAPLVAMPVVALLLVPRGIARHDALDGPVDALARPLSRGGIGTGDPGRFALDEVGLPVAFRGVVVLVYGGRPEPLERRDEGDEDLAERVRGGERGGPNRRASRARRWT